MSSEEVVRVVQQDAWEQPQSVPTPPSAEREPEVGDRIIIRQGRRPIPTLLNQIGTLVEIFRVPRDSCLVVGFGLLIGGLVLMMLAER